MIDTKPHFKSGVQTGLSIALEIIKENEKSPVSLDSPEAEKGYDYAIGVLEDRIQAVKKELGAIR